jgi:hypothetical protein
LNENLKFIYEQSLKENSESHADFWQIIQIASKLIHQEQSFEVNDKVKGIRL